jgi:hypothetical protein
MISEAFICIHIHLKWEVNKKTRKD